MLLLPPNPTGWANSKFMSSFPSQAIKQQLVITVYKEAAAFLSQGNHPDHALTQHESCEKWPAPSVSKDRPWCGPTKQSCDAGTPNKTVIQAHQTKLWYGHTKQSREKWHLQCQRPSRDTGTPNRCERCRLLWSRPWPSPVPVEHRGEGTRCQEHAQTLSGVRQ